jgi:ATP-dependent Clp protease ATP-binding subunit ClpC
VFERFTDRARRVLVLAQAEARQLDHNFIGTEHLLLGLLQDGEGVAAQALTSLGVRYETIRDRVAEKVGSGSTTGGEGSPSFTPRAKKVLELSLREALSCGHNYISEGHLLLGLLREGHGVAVDVLTSRGPDVEQVREAVLSRLSTVQPQAEVRGPRCPRCGGELEQALRYRLVQVVPEDGAPGEPMNVVLVYCDRCKKVVPVLRSL